MATKYSILQIHSYYSSHIIASEFRSTTSIWEILKKSKRYQNLARYWSCASIHKVLRKSPLIFERRAYRSSPPPQKRVSVSHWWLTHDYSHININYFQLWSSKRIMCVMNHHILQLRHLCTIGMIYQVYNFSIHPTTSIIRMNINYLPRGISIQRTSISNMDFYRIQFRIE